MQRRFTVLIKQSYRMTSRSYSTSMYETVHNLNRALESMQRWYSQVHGIVDVAFWFKKKKYAEDRGRSFVREGCVCPWSS